MEEKGCKPNVVTYTAMIDGFGKAGKVDKCLELFREMGSKGCAPNFVTYTVLINHCCASGCLDEAYALLVEMKQTYWPKYVSSYCKVIEGYKREFILSLGLLEEVEKNDCAPIIMLYRVLIDNFVKAGRLEVALELHKEVISASMSMAAKRNMYTTLIYSFSNATKIGQAFELFYNMIREGVIPDLGTLVHLIMGLIRVSRWEEALQLSDSICQMVCVLTPLISNLSVSCINLQHLLILEEWVSHRSSQNMLPSNLPCFGGWIKTQIYGAKEPLFIIIKLNYGKYFCTLYFVSKIP